MNWTGFSIGVAGIAFLVWVVLAARKESKRQGWKNSNKKLF